MRKSMVDYQDKKILGIVILISLILCILSLTISPIRDPDLWWHIAVGKWIVANKSVPRVDIWNAFSDERSWVAYSWLFEIVVATVDRSFSTQGLLILKLVLHLLFILSLLISIKLLSKNWIFSVYTCILVMLANNIALHLRPQLLSWILCIFVLLISDILTKPHSKIIKTFLRLLLAIVGCLWANLHITTIFGLLAVTSWSFNGTFNRSSIINISMNAAFFFIGTLITPYYGKEWLILLHKWNHPFIYSEIIEFQSIDAHKYLLYMTTACTFMFMLGIVHNKDLFRNTRVISSFLMLILGVLTVKFIPFYLIFASLTFAWIFLRLPSNALIKRTFFLLEKTIFRPKIFLLALTIFVLLAGYKITKIVKEPVSKETNSLIKAMNALLEESQEREIFPIAHSFEDGGYILYKLTGEDGTPKHKVIIDGRTNVTDPEIMRLYINAIKKGNWKDYLEKTAAKSIIMVKEPALINYLDSKSAWCKIFPKNDDTEDKIKNRTVFVKCSS